MALRELSERFIRTVVPGIPVLFTDEKSGTADSTITLSADTIVSVQSIYVEYTAAVALGDRQVSVEVHDNNGNVVMQQRAGAVQVPSTLRRYQFASDVAYQTAFVDTDLLTCPLPPLLLPGGYRVRVFGKNSIATASDDVVVRVLCLRARQHPDPGI